MPCKKKLYEGNTIIYYILSTLFDHISNKTGFIEFCFFVIFQSPMISTLIALVIQV